MSVLDSLIRAAHSDMALRHGLIDDISQHSDREQMKRVGLDFIRSGDFSAEGIRKFAVERGLGTDQMMGLVQLVKAFKEERPEVFSIVTGEGSGAPKGMWGKRSSTKGMVDVGSLPKEELPVTVEEEVVTDPSRGLPSGTVLKKTRKGDRVSDIGVLHKPEKETSITEEVVKPGGIYKPGTVLKKKYVSGKLVDTTVMQSPDKPEFTEAKAKQIILQLKKEIHRFETSGGLDPMLLEMMAAIRPDRAKEIMKMPTEKIVEETQKMINYMKQFVGDGKDPLGLFGD